MLTKDPKSLGAGCSDKINVMSKKQINSLIDNNVPAEKIFYGSHVDYLQALQGLSNSEVSNRNAHFKDSPTVLVALSALFEHSLATKTVHFSIIETILESCIEKGLDIKISLHPKMDRSVYEKFLKKYSMEISNKPISTLIGQSDLYIVGQGSSTIQAAELLETNTIVTDWYGLDYTTEYDEKYIYVAKSVSEFEKLLLRFSKVTKSMEEKNYSSKLENEKEILNKALWLTEGI